MLVVWNAAPARSPVSMALSNGNIPGVDSVFSIDSDDDHHYQKYLVESYQTTIRSKGFFRVRRFRMEVRKVGIVGVGTMGSQIGIVCARGGFQTVMIDVSKEDIEKGLSHIRNFLNNQIKRGNISQEDAERTSSLITTDIDLKRALSDVDLVIEAVFEDVEVKKEVFKKLDAACAQETILASNTSTLSITELAAVTGRPEKCIGTHFLIPAALTPVVELARGLETSDDTHRTIIEFLTRCGKETVTPIESKK